MHEKNYSFPKYLNICCHDLPIDNFDLSIENTYNIFIFK